MGNHTPGAIMIESILHEPQSLLLGLRMTTDAIDMVVKAILGADVATALAAIGFLLGVGGSAMLMIKNHRWAHLGWAMYLGSNACWVTYAIMTSQGILLAQNLCFSVTSLIGVWTWIVKPRLLRLQLDRAEGVTYVGGGGAA